MGKYFDEEEIMKLVEPEVRDYCEEIANDLHGKSYQAIAMFYADYSPKKYIRTGQLQGIITSPTIEKKSDKFYTIKLRFENINDNKFNGPFVQGYHGPPWGRGGAGVAKIMTPSPWNLIMDYASSTYNAYEC